VAVVTKLDCNELVDKEDPHILLQQKEHLASPQGQSPRCLRAGFFLDGPGESCRTKPPQPHHGRDHGGPPQCPTALLQCRRTSIRIVDHGAGDITDGHQAAASSRGGCRLGETLTAPPPLLCAGIWADWAKQALPGHSRPAGPHRRKTAAHRPHISSVSRSPSDPLNFRKVQKKP
jgi:hypothetical protein